MITNHSKIPVFFAFVILICGISGPSAKAQSSPDDPTQQRALDTWGKLVDQNGNPVSGATVHANVRVDLGRDQWQSYSSETDAQGGFHFSGLQGDRLVLRPEKLGYQFNPKIYSDRRDNYHGESNNPVILKMWKAQGAEQMVHSKRHAMVPVDGTPAYFDLIANKKVTEDGDLKISFQRNPVQIIRGKPFDWTLVLSVPNGGLVEMNDGYGNEAPESGYQKSVTVHVSSNDSHWASSFIHSYYFKARDGKNFGHALIEFKANYESLETYFSMEVYLNPSGSRNLEVDPKKVKTLH